MKIEEKTLKEIEKLVDKFIKSHAEKDETGKFTGRNLILEVSTPNLLEFLNSDEYRDVGRMKIPDTITRPREKREFHRKAQMFAKHFYKQKQDVKAYNQEIDDTDGAIIAEKYKEYQKLKNQEEWY